MSAASWCEVELGELLTLINGRAYGQAELLDHGTPVLRIQNLNGGDRWYYSDMNLPADKMCHAGDLLYAWSGSFGPYIWAGPTAIFHYHIWKIALSSQLDKRFAFYLLDHITAGVKAAGRGISMVHMTKSGMEAWKVRVPPLEEQKRIAAILDQADALRRLRARALDRLSVLGQAIFHEMFGQGTSAPLKCVTEFAEVKGGKRLPKGSDYSDEVTPHPYIRVSDLGDLKIDTSSIKYISPEIQRSVWRYTVAKGDVVISIAGSIGITAAVPETLNGANLTENAAKITPKNGVTFDPTYLSWALSMPEAKSQILAKTGQVTIGKLALFRIEQIEVPMPSIEKQRAFSNAIQELDVSAETALESSSHLNALFTSLQHRAFQGEL